MSINNLFPFLRNNRATCDPDALRSGVREAYSATSRLPGGKHPFPVGRIFAESIGYPADLIDTIPAIAWEAFVGVSNVAVFADIPQGATVLDIGCGSGLDSIIAAHRVGASGKVTGIDFSEDMLKRARQAVKEIAIDDQVEFFCAAAEELPMKGCSIDIILVNGIFNLNPKRDQVFSELSRVVKAGGKVYAAEMVFTEPVITKNVCRLDDWFS